MSCVCLHGSNSPHSLARHEAGDATQACTCLCLTVHCSCSAASPRMPLAPRPLRAAPAELLTATRARPCTLTLYNPTLPRAGRGRPVRQRGQLLPPRRAARQLRGQPALRAGGAGRGGRAHAGAAGRRRRLQPGDGRRAAAAGKLMLPDMCIMRLPLLPSPHPHLESHRPFLYWTVMRERCFVSIFTVDSAASCALWCCDF